MKNKIGTPIFREMNLGCKFCFPRSISDGFPVCANPLSNVENKPSGKWIINCNENSMECKYVKGKIQDLNNDIGTIAGIISNMDPDESGWIYFTNPELDALSNSIITDADDPVLLLIWLFSYWDYVLLQRNDMETIDDDIRIVFYKV